MARNNRMPEKYTLRVDEVKHETAKALLVVIDDEEHWIPLSQVHEIHRDEHDPLPARVVVTAWIAKKIGVI